MRKQPQYIVVDDDKTSNLISELIIRKFDKDAGIMLYNSPEEALLNIEKNLASDSDLPTVLFLDLNMPTMTGWDFLRHFEKFDLFLRRRFHIYILTSAIEDFSENAERFPFVSGFLSKPLNLKFLMEVRNNLEKGDR